MKATELEFLKYFYSVSDFGPADEDVRDWIKLSFMNKTGKELPNGYEVSDEEEE